MRPETLGANDFFQDKVYPKSAHAPIIVAARLKTPENMGFILRIAANTGCKKVIFLGTEDNIRVNKIKKTAQTSFHNLDWLICQADELHLHLPSDYELVAIETATGSKSLYSFDFPERCAFVVGNERHGIPSELLATCKHFVHIPMLGDTISMNVAHALAVVLFERVRRVLGGE